MFPPPVDFKFQQDSYKFVLVLVGIASFGFVYTVVTKVSEKSNHHMNFVAILYLFIVINNALVSKLLHLSDRSYLSKKFLKAHNTNNQTNLCKGKL